MMCAGVCYYFCLCLQAHMYSTYGYEYGDYRYSSGLPRIAMHPSIYQYICLFMQMNGGQ